MISLDKTRSSTIVITFLNLACLLSAGSSGHAATIPLSTAIPIVFTHTLEAGKVKPGDIISAKTIQAVILPGKILPRGTILTGHVVQSIPFIPNSAPYATQKPSILSIHFDKIAWGSSTTNISVLARAISGAMASREANILHFRDESDSTGTRTLVGGVQFSPLETTILSSSGKVVGYNRKLGAFARLLASDYLTGESTIHCDATTTEQSLGIFSPDACGVYDLDSDSMPHNGSDGDGTFVLESRRNTVKLNAQSTSLLEVLGSKF